MRDCGAAPGETLFVGDTEIDREAARRAGVSFVWAWDFFG
jgi:phosphoglycolate phosphatase-like HAD superfamily hydrolase